MCRFGFRYSPRIFLRGKAWTRTFEVVQIIKVIEPKILVDDVLPVLNFKLFDEMPAKQGVQAHDLDQARNLAPVAKFAPFLSVEGTESFSGQEERGGCVIHAFPCPFSAL